MSIFERTTSMHLNQRDFTFSTQMKPTNAPVYLLFVFCIMKAMTVFSQDKNQFEKETYMSSSGEYLPYRILKPLNFDSTKKYPIVLFLHGAGERGDDNEAQLTHGVSTFLIERYRKGFPCFVIAPQCPAEGYWSSAKFDRETYPIDFDYNYSYEITPALDAAIELLNSYLGDDYADTSRVYITGLSMGGMGTFEAVARFPDLFAAAVPVCGGGDPDSYNKETAQVPFWIFHGDADGVVPVKNSQKMYARLVELGADVKYREYPDVNHNSWDKAYSETALIPWVFSKRRR
ncbi:MAG: prolyl oligopeptidase family serine peptidase [Spirosomaceae bacterium]|nr:prolyl oligopeptidase family serine peptidase [Spirosomataceae bacterium]